MRLQLSDYNKLHVVALLRPRVSPPFYGDVYQCFPQTKIKGGGVSKIIGGRSAPYPSSGETLRLLHVTACTSQDGRIRRLSDYKMTLRIL